MRNNFKAFRMVLLVALVLMAFVTLGEAVEQGDIPANYIDPVTGMEFIFVKGGCFRMGDVFGDGEADEKPVHEVCLSDFYMGKYEVTQAQWEKVMADNPSANKRCGANCPVENISWKDTQGFIKRLNEMTGKRYRLPSEAEWEYAARSEGKDEKWAGTSDDALIGDYAWYNENAETVTHRVGTRKPNSLGLYDMSGNVAEWCNDIYDENYYRMSIKKNPAGPSTGNKRVLRGGGLEDKQSIRTVKRLGDLPDIRDGGYGFRLVLPGL